MRPILRNYQSGAKENIRNAFSAGRKRVVLRSEVGSGKTVMFSDLCYDVIQKGKCVMVVCNRQKLVRQSAKTLRAFDLNPYILMQSGMPPAGTKLIVASADTLRHRTWPSWIDMVVIDECHLASFTNVLEKAVELGIYVLGVSATPIPNKSNRLHEFYQQMICTKPTIDHIRDGELVMDIYVKADTSVDTSGLKTHSYAWGNDYSSKDLFALFDRPKIYDGMVANYLKYAKFKKAVCFCASVEHSKKSAEAFRAHGISAAHIDGADPEEIREKVQADFEAGKYHVLCNCAIYTFGWDCPAVEVVIVNRATASYELWRQMIGRGARPYGEKEYFLVIDQGGNKDRHGSLSCEVQWNLDAPDKKKKLKKGVAPMKACSNKDCGCLIPVQSTVCPICKTAQPTKKAAALSEAEFILEVPDAISPTPTMVWPKRDSYKGDLDFIAACIDFAATKKYHANFALNMVIKSAANEAEKIELMKQYAKAKHYKQGWVFQNKQRYAV
jgi:DNA repair protein RadD